MLASLTSPISVPVITAPIDQQVDSAEKSAFYASLNAQVRALVAGETDVIANLANVSALLAMSLPALNWVGFYLTQGDELVLGPFQGKPACVRIPWGRGVCGTAAQTGLSQLVADVHQFPGHIACDCASNSELVIPLRVGDRIYGVLDLDSPQPARFDKIDQKGLEETVLILQSLL
ncbi:MAG: GAF domain-containing protein [Aeromonas sp.]